MAKIRRAIVGRRMAGLGLGLLAVLLSSACGGPPVGHTARSAQSAPLAFTAGVPVGPAPAGTPLRQPLRLTAALAGTTAYLAGPSEVRLVAATDGHQLAAIRPRQPLLGAGGIATPGYPPPVTEVNGAESVVWPFLVRSGAGNAIELTTIATGTHAMTDRLVALPGWASASAFGLSAVPIGADRDTVVINLTRGLYRGALVVDASTGHTLWSRADFTAGAVYGDTVIGVEPSAAPATTEHVVNLALTDGRQRWAALPGYGLTVEPAGPHLVAAGGLLPGDAGTSTFQLLRTDTGTLAVNLPIEGTLPSRCVYDQVSAVVCTAPTDNRGGARVAIGVDAATGRQLWSMPDDNTGTLLVPVFTAGYRGILYARDTDGDTQTFQGATGVPVATRAGPAPLVVDNQAGLAVNGLGTRLVVYRRAAPGML